MNPCIKHVFVLMLENRSFDHMLGFSGIQGTDAVTKTPTKIIGLSLDSDSDDSDSNSNQYNGVSYPALPNAPFKMALDPGHESINTFKQICGPDAQYDPQISYNIPKPMSGFVWDYANSLSKDEGGAKNNFGDTMLCYDTKVQLPVMYSLASEYVVCDQWFSSMPGPTWPNRFFVHGASSMGLDDSPSDLQMIKWDIFDGFAFKNGSIYDAMNAKGIKWKIYSGKKSPCQGSLPCVEALKGITINSWSHFDSFAKDLMNPYDAFYTFIEPNYGNVLSGSYRGGQSQHPTDDVRNGEQLIKNVYQSIRNSPVWSQSVLIITYDEHGGFYDHCPPPQTVAPGDSMEYTVNNFDFTNLGIRVPGIIVSPLIERNLIDHTVYDHTSILRTIEKLLGIEPLTHRDENANDFLHLFTGEIRDCKLVLPEVPNNTDTNTNTNTMDTNTMDKIDLQKPVNNGLTLLLKKINHELGINSTNKNKEISDLIGNDITVSSDWIMDTLEQIEKYKDGK